MAQMLRNRLVLTFSSAVFAFGVCTSGVANARCGAEDRTAAAANQIANGHAYNQHALDFVHGLPAYFEAGVPQAPYSRPTIQGVVAFQAEVKRLFDTGWQVACDRSTGGRVVYYDITDNVVLIFNPRDGDCGTMFRPSRQVEAYAGGTACK